MLGWGLIHHCRLGLRPRRRTVAGRNIGLGPNASRRRWPSALSPDGGLDQWRAWGAASASRLRRFIFGMVVSASARCVEQPTRRPASGLLARLGAAASCRSHFSGPPWYQSDNRLLAKGLNMGEWGKLRHGRLGLRPCRQTVGVVNGLLWARLRPHAFAASFLEWLFLPRLAV